MTFYIIIDDEGTEVNAKGVGGNDLLMAYHSITKIFVSMMVQGGLPAEFAVEVLANAAKNGIQEFEEDCI